MRPLFSILLFLACFGPRGGRPAQNPALPVSGPVLSDAEWSSAVGKLEKSVFDSAGWLKDAAGEKDLLEKEIQSLQDKTVDLREKIQKGSNVFDEVQLKVLLEKLQGELEKDSALRRRWDERQKDFEQQSLSLVSLYNQRIEADMEAPETPGTPGRMDSRLDDLVSLAKKRNQIQDLIRQYRVKTPAENLPAITSFETFHSRNRDNLLLTLDLLRDRIKDLGDRLEKWSLERDELRDEIKLQGKMQEFLADIQRVNEDSEFPRQNIPREEWEEVMGPGRRGGLEARLSELGKQMEEGRRNLDRAKELAAKVQEQMDALSERKGR
jgi:hypothetical protein